MAKSPTPIWNRKIDLLYLVFFVIHVPIMLCVDLSRYYPANMRPQFTVDIRDWYIATYKDRFFIEPPLWFHAFMALELVYHIPLSLWAVGALLRDDALVPLHLLLWATETGLTTLVCCVEGASWGYANEEMIALGQLYLPYLILAVGMGGDMFFRVKNGLLYNAKSKVQ